MGDVLFAAGALSMGLASSIALLITGLRQHMWPALQRPQSLCHQ